MKKAIIPGTFDPITLGHIDIIKRAAKMADTVVVAVAQSEHKKPLFSLQERKDLVSKSCSDISNFQVVSFSGMLIDLAKEIGADCFVKGLRLVSDFEYELQMASINYQLDPSFETLFMMASPEYMALSSSQVRELAFMGGDYSSFVSDCVAAALKNKVI